MNQMSIGKAAVVVIACVFFMLGLAIEVAVVIHFLKDKDFHLMPNVFGSGFMLLAFATLLPMSLKEAGTILLDLVAKLPLPAFRKSGGEQ